MGQNSSAAISLTGVRKEFGSVVAVDDASFSVSLIPTTLAETTLGVRQVGDVVNLEVDAIAKYVERLMQGRLS